MTLMLWAGMPTAQPWERETLTKPDRPNVTPLVFSCRGKEDRERPRKRLREERKASTEASCQLKLRGFQRISMMFFYCYREKGVCLSALAEITHSHVWICSVSLVLHSQHHNIRISLAQKYRYEVILLAWNVAACIFACYLGYYPQSRVQRRRRWGSLWCFCWNDKKNVPFVSVQTKKLWTQYI